jgi:hypothetical protein
MAKASRSQVASDDPIVMQWPEAQGFEEEKIERAWQEIGFGLGHNCHPLETIR